LTEAPDAYTLQHDPPRESKRLEVLRCHRLQERPQVAPVVQEEGAQEAAPGSQKGFDSGR